MAPPQAQATGPDTYEAPLDARLEEAQRKLLRLDEQVQDFIRTRPVACMLGALALGYVVGKIAARY